MIGVLRRHRAGIVGLGLMFMWGSAYFPWIDLSQSINAVAKLIGALGILLVSFSGIVTAFYVNDVELKLRHVSERNNLNESEAALWKEQAQAALELLEKERILREKP